MKKKVRPRADGQGWELTCGFPGTSQCAGQVEHGGGRGDELSEESTVVDGHEHEWVGAEALWQRAADKVLPPVIVGEILNFVVCLPYAHLP